MRSSSAAMQTLHLLVNAVFPPGLTGPGLISTMHILFEICVLQFTQTTFTLCTFLPL